jgi:CubicO group peptidase (beta-lactamase class C family)
MTRFTYGCLVILAASALGGCMHGRTLVSTVVHNFPDLDDYRIFANRTVGRGARASRLRPLARTPEFVDALTVPDGEGGTRPLVRYLEDTRTAAFLVVQGERIVLERYAPGYDARSLFNSFSIAKSVVGTLVGIAVAEGRIPSLEATVAEYRPDLAGTPYGEVTLKSLLTMTSGVGDAPDPLPARASYYYGNDLGATVAGAVREREQGARWRYSEADVQVLGFVLEAAVGRPVSEYLAEKLWRPLGMEADALWALDQAGGREKAFCCLSARARDFARFGRLSAQGGRWHGRQLVPAAWAAHAVLPAVRSVPGYTHRQLWWHPAGERGDYYAYGHNGQYLYVDPASGTVIVKFSETKRQDPLPMFRAVADALRRPEHRAALERPDAQRVARR